MRHASSGFGTLCCTSNVLRRPHSFFGCQPLQHILISTAHTRPSPSSLCSLISLLLYPIPPAGASASCSIIIPHHNLSLFQLLCGSHFMLSHCMKLTAFLTGIPSQTHPSLWMTSPAMFLPTCKTSSKWSSLAILRFGGGDWLMVPSLVRARRRSVKPAIVR